MTYRRRPPGRQPRTCGFRGRSALARQRVLGPIRSGARSFRSYPARLPGLKVGLPVASRSSSRGHAPRLHLAAVRRRLDVSSAAEGARADPDARQAARREHAAPPTAAASRSGQSSTSTPAPTRRAARHEGRAEADPGGDPVHRADAPPVRQARRQRGSAREGQARTSSSSRTRARPGSGAQRTAWPALRIDDAP